MRRTQLTVHTAVSLLIVGFTAGCVEYYRPPTADQPHAIVKLRRTYSDLPGPLLHESATINEDLAFSNTARATEPAETDSVLIHPGPANWRLAATFYHMETRRVQESYQVQVPYQAQERYNCGTFDRPRTCYRSVTRYRYETRYRYVNKQVKVNDDTCTAVVSHNAEVGGVYLIQLTYQGNGVCRASCFIQTSEEVTQQPCGGLH